MSTFWDRWARFYDLTCQTNRQANAAAALRVAELVPAGARVLDCGAGTGAFSMAAAEKAASVLCTDLSLPMLEQARKKAKKRRLSRACLKHGNMPKRRLFFRHALPIFLEIHPVFLRQIGFVWRKNFSPLGIVPFFKQRLSCFPLEEHKSELGVMERPRACWLHTAGRRLRRRAGR